MGARSRGSGGRSRRGFHTVSCPSIMPNGMLVADGAQQLLADDHRHFSPAGDVHRSVLENPRRSEGRVLTAACAAADSVCMHELVAAGSKLGPRRVICRWPVRRNLQILRKQRARPRWLCRLPGLKNAERLAVLSRTELACIIYCTNSPNQQQRRSTKQLPRSARYHDGIRLLWRDTMMVSA